MNVISKLCLLSTICGLVACKTESQLDLDSLSINHHNQNLEISGFVITEQSSPLSVPEEYVQIHTLSSQLLGQHWLQHPNFLGDLAELKALFKNTRLPEAGSFIAALEQTKNHYINSLNNIDLKAKGLQREIDKDLDDYKTSIAELETKILFLQTSENVYHERVRTLELNIKLQSRQYHQINDVLRQSLQQLLNKHAPNIQLINELTFSYDDQPHAICRQYNGMSELLTTISQNCVYINRDQLLSPFPSFLKGRASDLIDSYAPAIWRSMTRLNGYFDTTKNKQYFPDNLKYQLAQTRQALREKKYINENKSALLLHRYQQELAYTRQQQDDTLSKRFLDQNLRIDTRSDAFINLLNQTESPVHPYADLYNSTGIKNRFTHAYAEKVLSQYPYELSFTVSPSGYFSIPNQTKAKSVIFNFTDGSQFLNFKITKRSPLPHIISSESTNLSLNTHSLIDALSEKLEQRWAI
ncbi:hypothetical protein [Photobacterium chitinilyticum]|uniref:Lipoprotein n=1 Tax=Photobacterium chitinilyticum TaxID=2485123 RepID=A0A444JPS5_9GAMM|nr:hypothetical protein [Photobacterium chitinilyticum]RWX55053.1 hypothetical protein EDI28_15085 [Photobacterium chitinilyticum]